MAKVNVEFDTQTKELSVSMDGQPIKNVRSINMCVSYDDPDEYCMSISTMDEEKEDSEGYRTHTMMVASESRDGHRLEKEGGSVHATAKDFIVKQAKLIPSFKNIFRQYGFKK